MTKLSICALFLVVFVVSDIVQGKGDGGGNVGGGGNLGGGLHVHGNVNGHGHGGHGHGGHGHGGHGHGGHGHGGHGHGGHGHGGHGHGGHGHGGHGHGGHGHGHGHGHGKKHVQVCKQADGSLKVAVNIPCVGGFTKTVGYDPERGVVVTDKTTLAEYGFNVCVDALGTHRVAGVDGEIGKVGLNRKSENGITVGNLNILNNLSEKLFQGGEVDCSKSALGKLLGHGGPLRGVLQGIFGRRGILGGLLGGVLGGGGGGGGKGGVKRDLVIDVHGGRGKGGSTGSLIDEGKGGGGGGCSSSSSSSDCSDSADGGPHGGAGLDGEFNVGQ